MKVRTARREIEAPSLIYKTWSVTDKWFTVQVAVIASSAGRAKLRGWREFQMWGDDSEYIDMRCHRVKSPIPVEGPERIIEKVVESLQYGFRWDDETMEDCFPGWYGCWLKKRSWD